MVGKSITTRDDTSSRDRLVVFSTADQAATYRILQDHFALNSNRTITLQNRYFRKDVNVQILLETQWRATRDDSEQWASLVRGPAFAIITQASDVSQISRAKEFWVQISTFIDESAICVLFVGDDAFGESETSELIRWGLMYNIEIVSQTLCNEDGEEVRNRVAQALECAPWNFSLSCEESDEVDLQHDGPTDFSNATRLRRGLTDGDVSRIIDDLALDADDDSEDGSV